MNEHERNQSSSSALVVVSSASGSAAGWLAEQLGGVRSPWVISGVALPLVAVLIADKVQHRAITTGFGWTDDLDEVNQVADELRRLGIDVEVDTSEPEEGPTLAWVNADARKVRRALRDRGLEP